MRVRLVRRPGQHGTREYVEQYGDRLICVRYRYDAAAGRRYKTIEIIVGEAPWAPPAAADAEPRANTGPGAPVLPQFQPGTLVGVHVEYGEIEVGVNIRAAGGVWRRDLRVWLLPYEQALGLGLADRIVGAVEGRSSS